MCDVVLPEFFQFSIQGIGIPEERLIKEFAMNVSDQSFDKGM